MTDAWVARCGGREVGRGETARAALREAKEAGWSMPEVQAQREDAAADTTGSASEWEAGYAAGYEAGGERRSRAYCRGYAMGFEDAVSCRVDGT